MPLQSLADEIIIVEPMEAHMMDGSLGNDKMTLVPLNEPLEVSDSGSHHEHSSAPDHHHNHGDLEVSDDSDIIINDILGAPPGTPDPSPPSAPIEVVDEPAHDKDKAEDGKSKKNEKWDSNTLSLSHFHETSLAFLGFVRFFPIRRRAIRLGCHCRSGCLNPRTV